MDLKDFISTSLTQIAEGILAASEALANTDAEVNPTNIVVNSNAAQSFGRVSRTPTTQRLVERVNFDVAVTAESSTAGKGGLKIGIATFGVNGSADSADKTGNTSRLQFAIPMVFPSKRSNS